MPIKVFENSSKNSEKKIDTTLFVQKPKLRANYLDSYIEEDIDKKNQFRFENLKHPKTFEKQLLKFTLIFYLTIQV